MVDLDVLKKHGVTSDAMKSKFVAADPDEKTKNLINLIRSRIYEGVNKNLKNAKLWYAIDSAFDAPFYQITPTLVKSIVSSKMDDASVLKAVEDFGLTHLIRTETVPGTTNTKRIVDLPAFFHIIVPVARAYATIRAAKIYNDRNIFPLFKYEPSQLTTQNRLRCEIITDRVQAMTSQYGYSSVMRQAIMNTIIYGINLQFPAEAWHKEVQIHIDDDGKEKEEVVREGLRYNLPHPSRIFWDTNYRVGTFNTDTGCTYAGYWQVMRYGDVLDNEGYWNKDKVSFGTNWMAASPTFFATLYRCTLKFPDEAANQTPRMAGSALDREVAVGFYASEQRDKAVTVTQLFMKITPKTYGIGDYEYPVWFRFVIASDSTVIWAEPFAYAPVIYRGYDSHEEREMNPSLVLEALPFQDHISNLLSQQILTIKQNLIAAVFTNTDAVGQGTIDKLNNLGQKLFTEVTFIPYSARAALIGGKDIKEAFIPVNFPRLDTTQIMNGINTMISVLERVLVMSSQEIGSAATHEQTAEETRVISTSTSNRLNFTASFIEDADLAWKKQLYDALMAYGEDEIYASIGSVTGTDVEKSLDALGFKVDEGADSKRYTRTSVTGDKTALMYESFASTRDSTDRINNTALAASMIQLLQVVFTNPLLFEAVGPVQSVKLINQVAALMGFFKDFRLETVSTGAPAQQQQEQMVQVLEKMKQAMEQEMAQAIQPVGKAVQQLGQVVPQLADQLKQTQQAIQAIASKEQQQDQALQQIGPVIQQTAQAAPELAQQIAQMQDGIKQGFAAIQQKDQAQDQAIQGLVAVLERAQQAAASMSEQNPAGAEASTVMPPAQPPPNPNRFRVVRV